MKLLVVDDDEIVLEALLCALEDAGFQVVPAMTGEDAVTLARHCAPDVVVTDLDLGAGMNGLRLAVELRRRWPGLPIVYISGRPWLVQERALGDREVFLAKPFRLQELLGGIRVVSTRAGFGGTAGRPSPA